MAKKKDKCCVHILRVKTSFPSINFLAIEATSGEANGDVDNFFFLF